MDARRSNQVWIVGGILVIILLITASWFLLISPKFTQADDVRAETDTASIQLAKLRGQVSELNAKETHKATDIAKLHTSQAALPTSNDMPVVLRHVQDAEAALNVKVGSFTVSVPAKSTALATAAEIPITLTATGKPADLSGFLVRLQTVYSRALLVRTITFGDAASTDTSTAADTGESTLSLGLTAFCLKPTKASAKENCAIA